MEDRIKTIQLCAEFYQIIRFYSYYRLKMMHSLMKIRFVSLTFLIVVFISAFIHSSLASNFNCMTNSDCSVDFFAECHDIDAFILIRDVHVKLKIVKPIMNIYIQMIFSCRRKVSWVSTTKVIFCDG